MNRPMLLQVADSNWNWSPNTEGAPRCFPVKFRIHMSRKAALTFCGEWCHSPNQKTAVPPCCFGSPFGDGWRWFRKRSFWSRSNMKWVDKWQQMNVNFLSDQLRSSAAGLAVSDLLQRSLQWLGGSDKRSVWGLHIPQMNSLFNWELFGATNRVSQPSTRYWSW